MDLAVFMFQGHVFSRTPLMAASETNTINESYTNP